MQRQWLESSVLASVGYDRGRGVLEVEFRRGGVYQYLGVPVERVQEMMLAPSQGSYFSRQIRDRYRSQKVM